MRRIKITFINASHRATAYYFYTAIPPLYRAHIHRSILPIAAAACLSLARSLCIASQRLVQCVNAACRRLPSLPLPPNSDHPSCAAQNLASQHSSQILHRALAVRTKIEAWQVAVMRPSSSTHGPVNRAACRSSGAGCQAEAVCQLRPCCCPLPASPTTQCGASER
jgi:hypothetical protein